ncbi:MAG: methylmalonyl Co-A mutase-associated GTPase MeaB [Bacteroidota bacterium]
MKGIEQPSQVNEQAVNILQNSSRKLLTKEDYLLGIRSGNRAILGQAITLIESTLHKHQLMAQDLVAACLPLSGKSLRIGITGVPGVGKSTFIEVFGKYLTSKAHKVAVLAIDPSSQRSKGSILGDKTRMETLSVDANAFIRPSPSAGSLGGVARKTQETLILCEAAGFDIVIIETVGVGQSETAVHNMVDFFLLLMLPGAGDELQGIKRGIMEMADALIINKADGDQKVLASLAQSQYQHALHLFPPPPSGWLPVVMTCSAQYGIGISEVWDLLSQYRDHVGQNDFFKKNRLEQTKERMHGALEESLRQHLFGNELVSALIPLLEKQLEENKLSPYVAAQQIIEAYQAAKKS